VSLFFVLSGFLLSRPFFAEAAGGRRVNRRRYLARRALRILPLYWLVVLVGTVVTSQTPAELLRAIPFLTLAIGFLPTFALIMPFTNGMWSLATEAQFYLLLPFLPLVLTNSLGRRVGLALLGVYAVAYLTWSSGVVLPATGFGGFRLGLSVFGRGWLFLFGMAAGWLYDTRGAAIRRSLAASPWLRRGGADGVLLAVLFALALVLRQTMSVRPGGWEMPPALLWHVPEGLCWAMVLLLVLLAPLHLKRLFRSAPLVGLGIISYSIYLLHMVVFTYGLGFIRTTWPDAAQGWEASGVAAYAALSLVTLACATLTYRVVERPFLRWGARAGR
jgi:peptidoglycan/LPS O-acetylase OafA/YrhL